jgi:metal-dependent amidase/aminoacylase/carboxypeptidase family protein
MAALVAAAKTLAEAEARGGLTVATTCHDIFAACTNDPDATALLAAALDAEAIPLIPGTMPLRASEDFGRFGAQAKAAMFFLGAGEDAPALHNPDYDFPDALIPCGTRAFVRVLRDLLG